jgi:hypothetical protein
VVLLNTKTRHKQTFKIIPQTDGVKRHEREEVGMGELLELIVELDGIIHIHRPQLWECLEAAVKDAFKRRSRHLSTRVEPALDDLSVELLDLAKTQKDIFRGNRVREGLIPTVVDEQDGEFLDTLRATMISNGGQSGNIEEANPMRPSKTFLVARSWRSDWPPHNGHIRTIHLSTSTARSIKLDMGAVRGGIHSTERCQVDGRWVPTESPLGHR